MFSLRNLINRRVLAGIVASVLTVSVALIVKSNMPTEARSRVYNTERISQRSPTKQKYRTNYRTPASKQTKLVVRKAPSNSKYIIVNNRSPLKNRLGNTANKSVNTVAQTGNDQRRMRRRNYPTPVTNRFGATGSRPSSTIWRSEIKRRYGIGNYPTPVTNRFNRFSNSGRKFASERWRAAIKRTYDIDSAPTPVTNRFGATGSRPSSELWRAEIKRRYGIGNSIRQPLD